MWFIQKSIDMMELRRKLEAHHADTIVAELERTSNGKRPDLNDPSSENAHIQMAVEVVRQQHGIDEYDPNLPSPALLNKLESKAMGTILYGRPSYEDLNILTMNY